jgi:ribosomal protein L35
LAVRHVHQKDGLSNARIEMPKLKAGVAGKRHRLISHNAKYIRQQRGTEVLSAPDTRMVKSYMPYA